MKMETRNSGLPEALALHQQGRLDEAIPLYQAFLLTNRKHAGAANLLGVALLQAGRLEEAAAAIRNAVRLDPSQASTHYNLGTVLQALHRNDEAATHFQKAIALKPDDAPSHNNLGVVLKALGRVDEAIEVYEKATALNPDFAQAHANLAAVLYSLERYDEAIQSGQRALALNPNLFEVHVSIGNALHEQGKTLEALSAFDRAIAIQPERPEAYFCAGNAMMAINFEDRAIDLFRRAVLLDPSSICTRFRLAVCLRSLKRNEEAAEEARKAFELFNKSPSGAEDEIAAGSYLLSINQNDQALVHIERALTFDSNSLAALQYYANALQKLQRPDEAMRLFDRIAKRKPRSDDIRLDNAFAALSLGDFPQGWPLFEHRFSEKLGLMQFRDHSVPRWNGQHISGSLLIWGEQAMGDQILYASMISDAEKRADRIVVDISPRLVALFRRSFPHLEIKPLGQERNEDGIAAHTPIGSLGGFFRPDWKDFPRRAYLTADETRAKKLHGLLHVEKKCVIGVSWRSVNPKFGEHKTARLQDFSPILRQPELNFVDLQYGETADELAAIRKELNVVIRHIHEIDNKNDIDGLAALIEACDAVVTVSNTTAHIAGALGKPVWILVPHGQGRHWYWFHDRKDSPWYPGARIVRQQPGQSWADLVASITPEIVEFAEQVKAKN